MKTFKVTIQANRGLLVKTFEYEISSQKTEAAAIKAAEKYTKEKGFTIIESKSTKS